VCREESSSGNEVGSRALTAGDIRIPPVSPAIGLRNQFDGFTAISKRFPIAERFASVPVRLEGCYKLGRPMSKWTQRR